jgi:RNA polymerase sigma factor (sigma-70 family)
MGTHPQVEITAMPDQQLSDVIRYVRRIVGAEDKIRTDRELLAAFTTRNDQAAFTTLVKSHGPMVMGICRRVLHHLQDAEDAFQATFLLLARQSADIRKQESLASWLHGVAYRMAHNAKRSASRRRKYEEKAKPAPSLDQGTELEWREVQAILDDEIQRLPETYRTPFLLFYLQNKKQADIAGQLGIKEGTVWSRLAHARRLLQERLSRRGVALPAVLGLLAVSAEAATAAVPGSLVSSVAKAATLSAAGGSVADTASAEVMALLQGAHRAMTISKCRIATLLLLAAGVVGTGFGFALHRSPIVQATEMAPEESAQDRPAPVPARPEEKKEIAVAGRVLDPAGKPVAGADVAVVLWEYLRFSSWEREDLDRTEFAGRTTSDTEGRFRLNVPQPPPVTRHAMRVYARLPGHALGWANIDLATTRADAEIRLQSEGILAGKVIDLQGGPMAGVKIQAHRLTWHKDDTWNVLPLPDHAVTATTDKQGRFVFHDLGRDLAVDLKIDDFHCAPKELRVNTGEPEKSGHMVIGVAPPAIVEGRVVCEDTGKPMANAPLEVYTSTKSEEGYITSSGEVTGRTDAQGHFKVSAAPGNSGFVAVRPPPGQPYLVTTKSFDWPKGAVRQEVEVKLSRGVMLYGKVTEAATGKPVVRASVQNGINWHGRVLTALDGSYSIAVPPGRTHLLVTAPTPDYIVQPVSKTEMELGKPGGDALYYHAVATLDLKKDDKPKDISFTLRSGVTLKGTLVDADGKPVKDAVMLIGGFRPPWEKALSPVEIHKGHWELHGCDPERTYHVLFLATPDKPQLTLTAEGAGSNGRLLLPQLIGPKVKFGASLEVSAKNAAKEPLEVRLKPAGSARLHMVDAQGKPIAGPEPSLELVATPGPTFAAALETGTMAAETVYLASNPAEMGKKPGNGDPPGTLTIHGLIPGATYRLRQFQQPKVLKDFTAEAGKTINVDVPVQ